MSAIKKLITGAAGAASGGGGGLNVEDVFSTYIYEGNGTSNTIDNGIDLSNEGGMVWVKNRDRAISHGIYDTERGTNRNLKTNETAQENYNTNINQSFTSTGFGFNNNYTDTNYNGESFISWTWRKCPKFFDIQTYTGTGSNQNISHNLGVTPGFVMVKRRNGTGNWSGWHRSYTNADDYLLWNSNASATRGGSSYNRTVNSSTYQIFGDYPDEGSNGDTYVAYFFAHNNNDGGFGVNSDQDIIKCGTYTANGTDQFIDLGFEPQWVMIKAYSHGGTYYDWYLFDNMRKLDASNTQNAALLANSDSAEGTAYVTSGYNLVQPTPTGMIVEGTSGPNAVGTNTYKYVYVAIRRGPMGVPTDVNDVFDVTRGAGTGSGQRIATGFPVDTSIVKRENGVTEWELWDRIRGPRKYLFTSTADSEGTAFSSLDQWQVDDMSGFTWAGGDGYSNSGGDFVNYSWRRAPNFFDTVAYTGTGSATSINHNLGVAPEMIWVKNRESSYDFQVWHKDLTSGNKLFLNSAAAQTSSNSTGMGTVSDTTFNIGSFVGVNGTSNRYIAHLFATLDGISKVGSFSHTFQGGNTNVDCGFSSGARFVLIKRISASEGWLVYDTARGIIAGNDPTLQINSSAAETSSNDGIDPYSAGFTMPSSGVNTGTYIFYAIA